VSAFYIVSAVLSGLFWSLFDLTRKKLVQENPVQWVAVWMMYGQVPLFLAIWAYEGFPSVGSDYWVPASVSFAANLVANLSYLKALSLAPFSMMVPILSISPVLASLWSFIWLHEAIEMRQLVGILFVVLGCLVVGWVGSRSAKSGGDFLKPFLLMLLTAVLWSIAPAADKLAVNASSVGFHGMNLNLVVALLIHSYCKFKGNYASFRQFYRKTQFWYVLTVVSAILALGSQLWVLQHIPVGIYEALKRAVGVFGSLILGYTLFKEPITLSKLFALLLIVLGVGLVMV